MSKFVLVLLCGQCLLVMIFLQLYYLMYFFVVYISLCFANGLLAIKMIVSFDTVIWSRNQKCKVLAKKMGTKRRVSNDSLKLLAPQLRGQQTLYLKSTKLLFGRYMIIGPFLQQNITLRSLTKEFRKDIVQIIHPIQKALFGKKNKKYFKIKFLA